MSTILVNGYESTEGELTIVQRIALDENNKKFILIEGVLVGDRYFEEIDAIESDDYLVEKVTVFQEVFRSESKNFEYHFEAKVFIRRSELE